MKNDVVFRSEVQKAIEEELWLSDSAKAAFRNILNHVRCCPCGVYGRLMYDDDFCCKGKRRADNGKD